MSVTWKKIKDRMPIFENSDVPLLPLYNEQEEVVDGSEEEIEEQQQQQQQQQQRNGDEEGEVVIVPGGQFDISQTFVELSKTVLTRDQHRHAVNKLPFFVILFTAAMAIVYYVQMINYDINSNDLISHHIDYFYTIFITLMFGIPLETAHGSSKIAYLLIASYVSKTIIIGLIHPYAALVADKTQTYTFMALHYTNVAMNWKEMPHRWFRIFALITIFVPITILNFYHRTTFDFPIHWQYSIGADLIHLVGIFIGIIFGCWGIYGNSEKNYLKYVAIPVLILIATIFAVLITNLFPMIFPVPISN